MTNPASKPTLHRNDKVLIVGSVGCGCLIPMLPLLGIIVVVMLPTSKEALERGGQETIGYDMRDEKIYFRKHHKFGDNRETFRGSDAPWSEYYSFSLEVLEGQNQSLVMIQTIPDPANKIAVRNYIGAVRAVGKPENAKFETILCMTPKPSKSITSFSLPSTSTQPLTCPKGTVATPQPVPNHN
jgi:hypothetical protein